jgi:hypothetical protein
MCCARPFYAALPTPEMTGVTVDKAVEEKEALSP